MTPAINLLPQPRDPGRRARDAFTKTACTALALGLAIAGLLHLYWRERVAAQRALNAALAREIGQLDRQLQGLPALRADIEAWTGLQAGRARSARLLSLLPQLLPTGLYLRTLTQEGEWVTLRGVSRSEQDLTEVLRLLAAPQSGFQQPELVEFTAAQTPRAESAPAGSEAMPQDLARPPRTTQFTLRVRLAPAADRESAR